VLSGVTTNTNCIVLYLTRPGLELTIYHIWGEQPLHHRYGSLVYPSASHIKTEHVFPEPKISLNKSNFTDNCTCRIKRFFIRVYLSVNFRCTLKLNNKMSEACQLVLYMQFKPVLLLYWVRDGLKSIGLIAPNWAPCWSYLLLPVYTRQHTAGFTENN
jgi:hypothetical protein